MSASRIIIYSPDQTKVLVGRESYFISNLKDITSEMRHYMDILFTRKVKSHVSHNDVAEMRYYSKKVKALQKNRGIMSIIRKHSDSNRITFGDIHSREIDGEIYSYTIPQYLPRGIRYSFPGGQPLKTNSNRSCALRELYEETGIDLMSAPYNVSKLINSGVKRSIYNMLYYILDDTEYDRALSDISDKNASSKAELHDLRFIHVGSEKTLSKNGRRNLKTLRIRRVHLLNL
jgi:8-oxo-dGTP pyrophosphatase MutT (NUDIX family)